MEHLKSKRFINNFVSSFPGDMSGDLMPRQTPGVLYSKVLPTPVKAPSLLAWSEELAGDLELSRPDNEDLDILAGNSINPSMSPYAACYAGHQFGQWAGQLGDGRAITLGELPTSGGRSFELQLKGAGLTPYSRRADGRAVLRSSVREYLMSEAMFYLGVPTTRALALVSTGEKVLRDMFYDGNPEHEPGAVVMRVSPSFLRFGNYEMLAARKEIDNLKKLVSWTIDTHFPHITGEDKVIRWFREVVEKKAGLMVEWLRVGFVHGVMNTDNMSVLGLTIDYGPYSFLDDYDPGFTPNTTDLPGRRYAFGKQASIAYWNLGCLASAIAPLFDDTKELIEAVESYQDHFWWKYYGMMGSKLGLDQVDEHDAKLIDEFEKVLADIKPDMTIFYQLLTDLPAGLQTREELKEYFAESFYSVPSVSGLDALLQLILKYETRISRNSISLEERKARMKSTNPRFILRNYLLHQAIEELERGEDRLFRKLEKAIQSPYSPDSDEFFTRRPEWAGEKAGCSMLSCSS